jgi:hypothetical protein
MLACDRHKPGLLQSGDDGRLFSKLCAEVRCLAAFLPRVFPTHDSVLTAERNSRSCCLPEYCWCLLGLICVVASLRFPPITLSLALRPAGQALLRDRARAARCCDGALPQHAGLRGKQASLPSFLPPSRYLPFFRLHLAFLPVPSLHYLLICSSH